MYRVVKKLHFSYGHRLLGYQGKCAHPHGHNAEVELELEGNSLDAVGMLIDFGEISRRLMTFIDSSLRRFESVWAAGGTPHHVFPIAPADLVIASGGREIDIV